MKKLSVAITSGGTKEKIDDVRVLTNVSSGKLGARIADKFLLNGHMVTYVAPKGSVEPREEGCDRWTVSNVETLMNAMMMLVPKVDVVIHPMAVSDFTFNYKGAVKLSSDSTEAFIDHMRDTITTTPKVISNFRAWNSNAILIGFKFTSGLSSTELNNIAHRLMDDNDLDMVFANDKKAMEKAGEHYGNLIMKDWEEKCHGKDQIADRIFDNTIRIAGYRF